MYIQIIELAYSSQVVYFVLPMLGLFLLIQTVTTYRSLDAKARKTQEIKALTSPREKTVDSIQMIFWIVVFIVSAIARAEERISWYNLVQGAFLLALILHLLAYQFIEKRKQHVEFVILLLSLAYVGFAPLSVTGLDNLTVLNADRLFQATLVVAGTMIVYTGFFEILAEGVIGVYFMVTHIPSRISSNIPIPSVKISKSIVSRRRRQKHEAVVKSPGS